MTMQVSNLKIGGFPANEIRDLLRRIRDGFREDCLEKRGYSKEQASGIIAALEQDGYVSRDYEAEKRWPSEFRRFKLTKLGYSLRSGSAAKPVSRKSAQSALDAFMERVREVNENPQFLERVTEIVVYGSYVRGAETLTDVDLACTLESKIRDRGERIRVAEEHFRKSDRECQRVGDDLLWPKLEVLLFLKSRKADDQLALDE